MEFDLRQFSDEMDFKTNILMNMEIVIENNTKKTLGISYHKPISDNKHNEYFSIMKTFFANKNMSIQIISTERKHGGIVSFKSRLPNSIKVVGVELRTYDDGQICFGNIVRYAYS